MLNLFKYDIKRLKGLLIYSLLLCGIMFVINIQIEGSPINQILSVVLFYGLFATPFLVEKRTHFDYILISLPVKKTDYVFYKYLSGILYLIGSNLIFIILSSIVSKFIPNIQAMNSMDIIISISIELIMISFLLPALILLNTKNVRIVTMIIFFISYSFLFSISGLENIPVILEKTSNLTVRYYSIALIFSSVLLVISILFTTNKFKKGDVR